MISIPIQLNDEVSLAWISAQRGYAPDISLKELVDFDSDMEGFEVYVFDLLGHFNHLAIFAHFDHFLPFLLIFAIDQVCQVPGGTKTSSA